MDFRFSIFNLRLVAALAVAGFVFAGCDKSTEQTAATPVPEAVKVGTPAPAPATPAANPNTLPPTKTAAKSTAPAPAEIWKEFSGGRAFEEARKQIEIGPRPSGTPEIEKVRALIEDGLRRNGWEVERQIFTDETPRGPVKFVNLIGRFSPAGKSPAPRDTQRAIVCSHYDTKRFSTIRFLGASDGASSTGALIELARVLALDPALAAKVELVFFDGEEAFVQYTDTDGLYGSRAYASKLRESGRAAQFKFAILWDMIGDRDLTITLSSDSPPDLTRDILASADALGLRPNFGMYERQIYDDHVPLTRTARIPAIDLIDFDYPAWHTADDNLEHISADSLQKVGSVTLHHLRKALGK